MLLYKMLGNTGLELDIRATKKKKRKKERGIGRRPFEDHETPA